MYILDPIYYTYKSEKRADLLKISKHLAVTQGVSRLGVMLDMVKCAVKYGCMWTEYGDLDFYFRSKENRATFLTTFHNFKLYDKLNRKQERLVFHEKIRFLETFSSFIKRDWLCIQDASDEKILDFIKTHRNIVAKASYSDSGRDVDVINTETEADAQAVLSLIKQKRYDLLEAQIYNHPELDQFNPSSLNTVRIVTVRTGDTVEFLFAGLRVGGKNAKIDNISQGGKVAALDLSCGEITSLFYTKASSHNGATASDPAPDMRGCRLPHWNEVLDTVRRAAMVVPEIRIVAWDIAITPTGIDIIEGNESFGSVIMQVACSHSEPGLKPRLDAILARGDAK